MMLEILGTLMLYLLPLAVFFVGIIALIFDLKVFKETKKSSKGIDDMKFTVPHITGIPIHATSKETVRIIKAHDKSNGEIKMSLSDVLKEYGTYLIELNKSIDELKKKINKMDFSIQLKPINYRIDAIEQKLEKINYEDLIDEKINSVRNELSADIKNLAGIVDENMETIEKVLDQVSPQEKKSEDVEKKEESSLQ